MTPHLFNVRLQSKSLTTLSKHLKRVSVNNWNFKSAQTPDTTPPEIRAAEREVNRKLARYQGKRQKLAPVVSVTEQEKLIDLLG